MAVNPRAFIKPAVALGGIDSHEQHVALAEISEIRYVEAKGIVAAAVPSDVEAVEHDHGLAVRAIELDGDSLAGVLGTKVEHTPVPADTRGRIFAAQRVEAFVQQIRVVMVGQLNRPIVRQVEAPPVAIVESD